MKVLSVFTTDACTYHYYVCLFGCFILFDSIQVINNESYAFFAKSKDSAAKDKAIKLLVEETRFLLNEDVSGETKTTRIRFRYVLLGLRNFDEGWAVDASIKLLEKMWEWNKAVQQQLKPHEGEN